MPSRFVTPETRTLQISNGDTLLVRKRLNHGERQASYARMYHQTDGGLRVNSLQTGMALVTAYLLDWSLTDDGTPTGKRIPILDADVDALTSTLNGLEPESFTEILRAIEAHETAMAAERAEEKKMAGANASSPTSPLPVG